MRNFRTFKSKYSKKPDYFVNQNGNKWEVVEFPTNDIVRTFARKTEAEMFSDQLKKVKPFGDRCMPKFMKE